MNTIITFTFAHKKDGDSFQEDFSIEELIYGIGDSSKQPFKEYIEGYTDDGYKITDVKAKH